MSLFRKAAYIPFTKRYLFITNTVSSGILMGLGDLGIQLVEKRMSEKLNTSSIDWYRAGRLFIIGIGMGPMLHFWYRMLDRRLPGANALSVAKKIFFDMSFASPCLIAYFFIGTNVLENHSVNDGVQELKQKFFAVYLVDASVWPAAQGINFFLLPPKYRVIYVAVISCAYNMFLSGMKHMKDQSQRLVGFVNEFVIDPLKKR